MVAKMGLISKIKWSLILIAILSIIIFAVSYFRNYLSPELSKAISASRQTQIQERLLEIEESKLKLMEQQTKILQSMKD